MPLVSLRHLHAFSAVAAAGGIRRSSESLFRASSAVARSVAALEDSLGVQLFERKGRGMLLTRAGETVRLRADRIEAELREVRDDALRMNGRGTERAGNKVGGIDAMLNERRLQSAALLAEAHYMPGVAHALGASQSAISQAITHLENMLGQPLFLRTAHGMLPTDAGRRWIERFERVLAELRHIPEDIAALAGIVRGVVTIGALPLARSQFLPLAIAAVQARHPHLVIRSLESPYDELTAGLLSGRIDFILGALRPSSGVAFVSEALFEDKVALVARAGHPLAGEKSIAMRDLERYPWVLSRAGTPLREQFDRFFEGEGAVPPAPVVETGDLALARGLLLAGDMLTVLSVHQLYHEIRAGQLVELRFALRGMERAIGITTRRGAHLSPGASALIGELRQLGASWS
ncbi:LysR family transcriptional regulator [Telluria mixta]|uniref:LysR family transcriptional regulator n=1 Tax=Telluria mixta TaxID=34071 RepID=A0ABT2C158_9BURK|nr:LysR family transcriptional regulator [Telluria mixta]MCS0631121.1 LysR family transcriptional regulator [Telluria mixta]WEM95661.1 LysR family transcriptional regulator [Telluria mixta]